MKCLLPSLEETSIEIEFADGQPALTVDAVDLDDLIAEVNSMKIPEDSSWNAEYARLFKSRYGRKLGPSAIRLLLETKQKILEAARKKLYPQDAQSDTTDSATHLTNDPSNSSEQSSQ